MANFKEINPQELGGNAIQRIGTQWMLVATKDGERVNMMTASWGGIGVLWNKPVVYVFIRPQRFTKSLVDKAEGFSLTFFGEEYRSQLHLCGTKSGRDLDKVAECGFGVSVDGEVPYFDQAETVLVCKKLYRQTMDPDCFIEKELDGKNYPAKDYHDIYVAEITRVLVKE